jgi:DNA-binding MarR family transcriptional regulator
MLSYLLDSQGRPADEFAAMPKSTPPTRGIAGSLPGDVAAAASRSEAAIATTPATSHIGKHDFEVLSNFRYQLRRFLRFSEEAAHSEGLTPQQYLVLLHIKGFPGRDWAHIGELAERLQLQPHGVVALVSRCEALGLVKRQPSQQDRRQVEVHLQEYGMRCLSKLAALHRAELKSLRGAFKVPDLEFDDAGTDTDAGGAVQDGMPPVVPPLSGPRKQG